MRCVTRWMTIEIIPAGHNRSSRNFVWPVRAYCLAANCVFFSQMSIFPLFFRVQRPFACSILPIPLAFHPRRHGQLPPQQPVTVIGRTLNHHPSWHRPAAPQRRHEQCPPRFKVTGTWDGAAIGIVWQPPHPSIEMNRPIRIWTIMCGHMFHGQWIRGDANLYCHQLLAYCTGNEVSWA